MATHTLKIRPEYFEAILDGTKRFEIRKNDRGYQKGDIVYLEEIEQIGEAFRHTGRVCKGMVGYVTNFMQKEDVVVFTFIPLPADDSMKGAEHVDATTVAAGTAAAGGASAAQDEGAAGTGDGRASEQSPQRPGKRLDPSRVGEDG